jgi:predicted GIY-YIG superfamily endonuclease/proteasome lid subunit RPN8/RPN11
MVFWAYLLNCRGGSFYAGHTDDLERRIAQHKSGLVAGYTRDRLPVELVWSQEFPTRVEAIAAERQIKGWSKAKKLALIRGDWAAVSHYARKKDGPSTSSGRTEVLQVEADEFEIGPHILPALRAHAAREHPNECCGLLLGEGGRITSIQPAANVHPAPKAHFEIDPAALIAAHREARNGGPQVIGYYHSHPSGPAAPSATDRALAAGDGLVWAIIAAGAISWWRDAPSGFTTLSPATKAS